MCAVAQRLVGGLLARAEERLLAFRRGPLHRRERAALVAAVTERLFRRFSARAPPVILAGLDIDADRRTTRNYRLFAHLTLLRYRPTPPASVASHASPHAFANSRTRRI